MSEPSSIIYGMLVCRGPVSNAESLLDTLTTLTEIIPADDCDCAMLLILTLYTMELSERFGLNFRMDVEDISLVLLLGCESRVLDR